MEALCPPQGVSGKDQELVLGLGHLNNSYNFSVSVRACLQPFPSAKWGRPQAEVPPPLCLPRLSVPCSDRL